MDDMMRSSSAPAAQARPMPQQGGASPQLMSLVQLLSAKLGEQGLMQLLTMVAQQSAGPQGAPQGPMPPQGMPQGGPPMAPKAPQNGMGLMG